MVVPFLMMTRKKVRTRRGQEKSPPMSETKCQWGNNNRNMGKVKHRKTTNPENWLTRKKGCCSQWRVVSMQATSPFSDTRISIFQNISTSLPLHQSYSSKSPWRFATVNPPPGRLQHHQGTGDAEIFILTRLHGMKPWPILLRCLSSDTTFASGRCISEMDPVWQDLFFPLQHGFPHWEEMVFGGSQNLVFFFFANRSGFSTTQLDSIPSSRFRIHPFSHVLSPPQVFAWNQATHLHQSGFRTNLKVSLHIQPFQTSGFQAATQDFWTSSW